MAEVLNNFFGSFDYQILESLHNLAETSGNILRPLCDIVSFVFDNGIVFFILGLILLLFKKTRKIGICLIGALGLGTIIAKFGLKDFVARPRPFMQNDTYNSWWQFIGTTNDTSFSFPSGHTTMTMAGFTTLFIYLKKRYSSWGILGVLLVTFSRCYLMVHYPSDILGGILVGLVSAIIAWLITKLIYYILEKYKDKKFFKFILEFNIVKNK
ncbi:MAG: phosphatase PAP2 family protein [Clostridia bacterium]|nr:phosphatase PAP2 family protein [Clostridia bacterium]